MCCLCQLSSGLGDRLWGAGVSGVTREVGCSILLLAPRFLLLPLARRFLLRKESCGLVTTSHTPNESWLNHNLTQAMYTPG